MTVTTTTTAQGPPAYTPLKKVGSNFYYPEPYSLDPLPVDLQHGLIPVGLLAILSVGATLMLICFILHRLVNWKIHYKTFLGYNQYVILVLNLLLADLQQSSAFLISFHWIRFKRILAPTSPCTAQAWLLHSGDVSSGFFVLAIALHTFITAVHGKRIGHKTFLTIIISIWVFAYFLTAIGFGLHGEKYFVRAGAWCWISEAYEDDRLALHYIWVFLVQFGTVLIYIVTFLTLRKKTKRLFSGREGQGSPNLATVQAINRITKLMTIYPCVYVLLTLPLSAGRMWSMAHNGKPYSDAFACVAGAMITSCGWVDSLLYTLTRRRLLRDTMPNTTSRRTGSNWDTDLGSKGITHTRTVTVEGGQVMDTLEPAHARYSRRETTDPEDYERPPSPNGSVAPILSGHGAQHDHNKTEISVGVHEMPEDPEKQEDLPLGWTRYQPG